VNQRQTWNAFKVKTEMGQTRDGIVTDGSNDGGSDKPTKFPTELIKAMPEAAENPARNLLGVEKNGPKKGAIRQLVVSSGHGRCELSCLAADIPELQSGFRR
jgi:hypothetical protein